MDQQISDLYIKKMFNFYTIPVATIVLMQLHVRETGLYVVLNIPYLCLIEQR